MQAPVTSFYAALLALLFVLLSMRVIRVRHRTKVAFGTADDPELERRTRVHANFAEYVPFALLLIALVELGGAADWAVHALGLTLLAGRAAHAYGVSRARENFRFRIAGMAMSFTVLLASALYLLGGALA
ncbi:MAG: hypothetical protein AVDCRST_MAG91-3057 [uncultured Sphingomonadaceae bacterium]|uniref:Membrane protein STY2112 n=1 Tax=uncultured Sphingomonadaceae bacterium TaxID=169976 RepID=A0A6J4TVK5_9SPHN|nr:MAG: hypothetical protein AVDCRST_MAG91-3057 [uncultured Sphingomonadaceae bacterium]